QVRERAVHERDALLELRLLVLARVVERALEVVEHRHELLDEPLVGARGQLLLVARHPLAVVVELGLQPLQGIEVVVALLRHRRELVHLFDLLDLLLDPRLLAHLSSTTSYSASSTTSSSETGSPSAVPLPAPPVGCADACAYSACAASVHADCSA